MGVKPDSAGATLNQLRTNLHRLDPLQREQFHEAIRGELKYETALRNRRLTTAFVNFIVRLLCSSSASAVARAVVESGLLRMITLLAISTDMFPFLDEVPGAKKVSCSTKDNFRSLCFRRTTMAAQRCGSAIEP